MSNGARAKSGRRGAPPDENPRWKAALAVAEVLAGRSLSTAVPALSQGLGESDQAGFRELCFGTVRWALRLQAIVSRLMERPLRKRDLDLHGLLLVGLYQLEYMRVPDHAAVSETVNAARGRGRRPWASGLLNGVLREYLRRRDDILREVDADASSRLAHPEWLLQRLQNDWPKDWHRVADAGNQRPPMALRVALDRISRADEIAALKQQGLQAQVSDAVPSAIVLGQAVDVERLPGFAQGSVSVQDSAAQLAAHLLAPAPGDRVLDACAAPGGKTGHLLEIGGSDIDLLAVDDNARRLERVRENLSRLGRDAVLAAADVSRPDDWWDGRSFQKILLDAPCSASGVVRRHPDIKLLRRPEDVDALARRQSEMLHRIWQTLAPGGTLLYATCSLLRAENERVVGRLLAREPQAEPVEMEVGWGRTAGPGRQILPGEGGMDGFYYCLLRKRTSS